MQSNQSRDRGRILTPEALAKLERAILAWETQNDRRCTYECLKELTSRIRPGGLDTKTLGKIRKAIEKVDPESIRILFQTFNLELKEEDLVATTHVSGAARVAKTDWGEKPDTSIFLGRSEALATLRQWIVTDHCRWVTLLGMGGIGKTALAAKLVDQIQGEFEYVMWRSLREAPPLDEILVRLIQFVSDQQETEVNLPSRLGERLNRLVDYLRQRRCLLILDNAETIFQESSAGQFRVGYEHYGELFKRMGETSHQSCLLMTSREKPRQLAGREGTTVRCWPVGGMESADSLAILMAKGVVLDSQQQGDELIRRCGGNPQILRLVASEIQQVFFGDVADFLNERITDQEDVRILLGQHFQRLAPLERSVMYWLMINREPVTVEELLDDLLPTVAKREVLTALRTLLDRSLIEAVDKQFTLQNVIMEYLTDQFVEQIKAEIKTREFNLFHDYALIKATAKNYVRETQIRLILQPIYNQKLEVQAFAEQSLEKIRQNPEWCQGYAPGNILNLLCQLNPEVSGFNFSSLLIRQADLRAKNLYAVNFTDTCFTQHGLTQSFSIFSKVVISPDGEILAHGDNKGIIYLWQVKDRRYLATLEGHSDWIPSVAFSPDGQTLASSSGDKTIRLWNLKSRQCFHTIQGANQFYSITFSPDGQILASGGWDKTIHLWNLQSLDCFQILAGHTDYILSVAFSPDSKTLVSHGKDNTIRLWDLKSYQCLHILEGHTDGVCSVVFSPNGQILASGSRDRTIRIWDLKSYQCLHTIEGHLDLILSVAFSPDGQILASGSQDQTIRLWDVKSYQCLQILEGHRHYVQSVTFSPDGQTLISGSRDDTIRLWDLKTRQCLHIFQGYETGIFSVVFSPDGKTLATGGMEKTIRLWDVQNHECYDLFFGHTQTPGTVAFSPDGQFLASGGEDKTIRLWDVKNRQCLHLFHEHTSTVRAIMFSPDGETFASACYDQTVRLWDVKSYQCLYTFQGHTNCVYSVAFSPNGEVLASGGIDQNIHLWDVKNYRSLHIYEGHTKEIWSIAFSPKGDIFASGSMDETIRLWNLQDYQCFHLLEGQTGGIRSVAFSPDGQLLASGSGDQTIRLWNMET